MARSRREYFRRTRKVRMRNLSPSKPGWIGFLCAAAAVLLFWIVVAVSYRNEGEALYAVGIVGLFALILAVGGLVLGIMGLREEDVRPLPPRLAVAIGAVMSALLIGLYLYGI